MPRKSSVKNVQAPSNGARWVLFMPTIPAKPASVRVKIWRRLKAIGAVGLRGSVYALPNREECVEVFEWVSRELRELGGQASICEGRFLDGSTDDDIERRFIDARNADYAEVADGAKQLLKKLDAKRITPERITAITDEHAKLVHRLGEITAIDFLNVPGREAVEGLLAAVARALPRDGTKTTEPLEVMARPRGATWVTRTGVHVDRIASSWLIRRFVDPEAQFKFVPAKGYAPNQGELRFDMFEAEFTHVGDRCTFEVLVERMDLRDPALVALGEIIHDLDLRDDKFGRDETAGVRSAVDGICTVAHDDEQRIAAASPMLDGLYSHFSLRTRRRPARANAAKSTRAS
ncbi:MAG TPA: chromate resistance protein ChrB domain-containing protein [Kofleriaceae bacterium]|nr:chromate resistance protein ChrB domain-containing protein [Kofleriaceae bacterium]